MTREQIEAMVLLAGWVPYKCHNNYRKVSLFRGSSRVYRRIEDDTITNLVGSSEYWSRSGIQEHDPCDMSEVPLCVLERALEADHDPRTD